MITLLSDGVIFLNIKEYLQFCRRKYTSEHFSPLFIRVISWRGFCIYIVWALPNFMGAFLNCSLITFRQKFRLVFSHVNTSVCSMSQLYS